MEHLRTELLKSKLPIGVTEEDIKKDQRDYVKAVKDFPKSVGIAAPMHKYPISKELSDDFQVKDDPIVEPAVEPTREMLERLSLEEEATVLLNDSVELILNHLVSLPNSSRELSIQHSELQRRRKRIAEIGGL